MSLVVGVTAPLGVEVGVATGMLLPSHAAKKNAGKATNVTANMLSNLAAGIIELRSLGRGFSFGLSVVSVCIIAPFAGSSIIHRVLRHCWRLHRPLL
jgi:hypothetical protein